MSDSLSDILALARQTAPDVPAEVWQRVELAIRQEFGAERHYRPPAEKTLAGADRRPGRGKRLREAVKKTGYQCAPRAAVAAAGEVIERHG